jgi:hypothetical protein
LLKISPIPLCFGLVNYNIDDLIKPEKIVYLGPRHQDSIKLLSAYANKTVEKLQVV